MKTKGLILLGILATFLVVLLAAGGGNSPAALPAGHPGHTMSACDNMPERPWDLLECYRTYENRYFDHSAWTFKTRPAFSICVNMAEAHDISGASQVGDRSIVFVEKSNCHPNPFARPEIVYQEYGGRDSRSDGEPPVVKPTPLPRLTPVPEPTPAPVVKPDPKPMPPVKPALKSPPASDNGCLPGQSRCTHSVGGQTRLFGDGCDRSDGCPIRNDPNNSNPNDDGGEPCWEDGGYDGGYKRCND